MPETWYDKYENFVKNNVETAGELETAIKWLSYIVAGRSKESSSVFAELLYSSSNVLTLINDRILLRTLPTGISFESLKFVLSLLEYIEVFVEISSLKLWGKSGKWVIITLIQTLKAAMQLYLLWQNEILVKMPPISPLTTTQRKFIHKQNREGTDGGNASSSAKSKSNKDEVQEGTDNVQMTFTLKRSGRVIRTIAGAPPLSGRTWMLPDAHKTEAHNSVIINEKLSLGLTQNCLHGELLHIARPLVHLLMMKMYGTKSWKPWLISLMMDLVSIHKIKKEEENLNAAEKSILMQRCWALLFYFLRSPMFDRYSKFRILRILTVLSETIPGASFICKPMAEHFTVWQKIYFYIWSS